MVVDMGFVPYLDIDDHLGCVDNNHRCINGVTRNGNHRGNETMSIRIINLSERALKKWGVDPQINQFIEEAAEAIEAVSHHRRGKCDFDDVCGELADLLIMLTQMRIMYGADRFDRVLDEKLDSLEAKLDDGIR